jgi:hypothetical protein
MEWMRQRHSVANIAHKDAGAKGRYFRYAARSTVHRSDHHQSRCVCLNPSTYVLGRSVLRYSFVSSISRVISCHILSYPVISYHIISYHIIIDHVTSRHIISYHTISKIYIPSDKSSVHPPTRDLGIRRPGHRLNPAPYSSTRQCPR